MSENILEVKNLHVSFKTYAGISHAVRGVDFSLRKGETLAIVGESGCGKTVTSKAIMGLLPAQNTMIDKSNGAQILFQGDNLLDYTENQMTEIRGSKISMIFQDPMTSLNPTMRIGEQIAESILIHTQTSKEHAMKEAERMLELVKIPNAPKRMRQYPFEFSGGMRQRAMIAVALACKPEILIADEPTTALDVTIQAQIMDLLAEIQQKLGMTVILITHDLGVVANSADRVVVMYSGKVVETGTCTEIFEKHKHPYTWALLKAAPDMELGSKQKLVAIEGTPPDLILPPKGCPFAERCGHCMKICLETEAPRYTFSKDHSVFCWLYHPESGYTDITFDEGEIE